ncbi:retrovirus-related Pol polyprotein from transposon 412 [Nephila pilipes]|uniref:Retrovirus-related Pol polyprotein from transposon 412 n=1 Tax=Nephila pilipes TaxID=299642 RepID=A0A8X6Q4M2_NEPPI|nr:retrovirus-related Pol polyprotein from transposon 412 [Nephila pilipes]
MEINGVDRVCLRGSGSSIDVCARSWIQESDLLREYVWLKSPLDDVCHCLPLAKIKIKTKSGEFYTKAAIKPDGRCDDPYLLGNRTAELINSSEQGIQLINAVVTRRAGKIHPTEAGKEIISRGLDLPLKLISPSEEKEEKEFEISPFEGGKEIILAKINGSEFEVEQKKCKDLKVLWDKAKTGVDREFGIYNGKLVKFWFSRRRRSRYDQIGLSFVELFFSYCRVELFPSCYSFGFQGAGGAGSGRVELFSFYC